MGVLKNSLLKQQQKQQYPEMHPAMGILELDDNGYFIKECQDCDCDPCECEEESEVSEGSVAEALKKANYNTYRM